MKTLAALTLAPIIWAALFLTNSLAVGQESPALSLKGRIALHNVDGRMDHFAVDVKGQRLFVSALGNHTAEVLDLQAGRRVRTLPDLEEPQGQFYDASTNRLFVAAGDGATKIYDGSTFQLLQTVKLSDDADNIRYDARSRHVVVGYGGEKAISLISPRTPGSRSPARPGAARPRRVCSFQAQKDRCGCPAALRIARCGRNGRDLFAVRHR